MRVAEFDRRLYEMKLAECCHELHKKTQTVARRVGFEHRKLGQGMGVGFYAKFVDAHLEILREHLQEVDRICREVWQAQGGIVTPEFVRAVIRDYAVFTAIAARCGSIRGEIELMARRTGFTDLAPVLHDLARKRGQLENIMSNRYEIQARELAYQNAPITPTAVLPAGTGSDEGETTKVQGGEKAKPTYREVTKAPAPPMSVGGLGITHTRDQKASEIPHDPPTYFPSDLWPQTNVILLKAQRRFPLQTQTLELCKHVTSEMTPIFVEAVKAEKIEAGAVQRENGGGMEDLLHSLLVYNDDGPKSGFSSLSDQAYRLGQEVRKSDEWLRLGEAIAETQSKNTGAGRNTNQTESSRAQNDAKTGQGVENKSKNEATAIGRNIQRLRKECGWSLDVLAAETGIDKKSILSHVNKGAIPIPRILKEYAQAFSKALGRSITAPDLEK